MSICRDVSDEKVVGLTGYAKLIIQDRPITCSVVVRRKRNDPEKSDARLNFMTEDFEPYLLPEGIEYTLYGYNK